MTEETTAAEVKAPMDIKQAVVTFKAKYPFKEISTVGVDEETGTIHVYVTNAKIWVDLPARHEGYYVKMNVVRRIRPAAASATNNKT